MSISVVQSKNANPGVSTSSALTFSSLPTAGHMVVVKVTDFNAFSGDSHGIGSIADNQSPANTYTLAVDKVSADGATWCQIYYCLSVVVNQGTFTITITGHSGFSFYPCWSITEINGGGATFSLDQTNSATGSSTSPSVSATTTGSSEYVAACCCADASQASITDPTSYTQRYTALDYTNHTVGNGDDRILTSVSTESPTWTLATSAAWAAVIATFKATGGGVVDTFPAYFLPRLRYDEEIEDLTY